MTRPREITIAVVLLLVQAVWAVGNAVLVLASQGQLRDAIRTDLEQQGLSSTEINDAVDFGVLFTVVGGIVVSALLVGATLVLVWLDLKGKRIGRTLTLVACGVFLAMTVVSMCTSLTAGAPVPGWFTAVVQSGNVLYIAIYVAVILLLRRPAAVEYFEKGR